jgi:hypothetical protein
VLLPGAARRGVNQGPAIDDLRAIAGMIAGPRGDGKAPPMLQASVKAVKAPGR